MSPTSLMPCIADGEPNQGQDGKAELKTLCKSLAQCRSHGSLDCDRVLLTKPDFCFLGNGGGFATLNDIAGVCGAKATHARNEAELSAHFLNLTVAQDALSSRLAGAVADVIASEIEYIILDSFF
jgi:hypothetical protein